jgi:hypothetical protein
MDLPNCAAAVMSGENATDDGDNEMNEKDHDIGHPGVISKAEPTPDLGQFSNSPWTRSGGVFDLYCPAIAFL